MESGRSPFKENQVFKGASGFSGALLVGQKVPQALMRPWLGAETLLESGYGATWWWIGASSAQTFPGSINHTTKQWRHGNQPANMHWCRDHWCRDHQRPFLELPSLNSQGTTKKCIRIPPSIGFGIPVKPISGKLCWHCGGRGHDQSQCTAILSGDARRSKR